MENPFVTNSDSALPGITRVADAYDCDGLFELLDNDRIVELSRLKGDRGFSDAATVLRSTGILTRRILRENLSAVDLALAVCRRLEQISGFSLSSLDAVLLCHSHVDAHQVVAVADELRDRLFLPDDLIRPFNHGCCGFLKLLHDASLLFEQDDLIERVALLTVETPEFWHDGSDRLFCGIVSAGATAVLLERGRGMTIESVCADDFRIPDHLRPNPDPLFHIADEPVVCFRGRPDHRAVMRMNAEPVFLNGIELMLSSLRSAVSVIEPAEHERVVVIPHQPSGKLLKALIAAAKKEFPRFEFLNNLKEYGNTISSTIPTVLSRLPEVLQSNERLPLREGDHLILLAAGICMEERANSMSAGYACLRWVPADRVAATSEMEIPSSNLRSST